MRRSGKWELLPGEALLPGDIISIGRPSGGAAAEEKVVPADCLLLAGNCIVEEAVLTGLVRVRVRVLLHGCGVKPPLAGTPGWCQQWTATANPITCPDVQDGVTLWFCRFGCRIDCTHC